MSEKNILNEKELDQENLEPKIEIEQTTPEFEISSSGNEINSSKLGVFQNNDIVKRPRDFEEENPVDLGTAKKEKPKIDFERFTRTKTKNQPTSSFGLKVDGWLRNPKILKNTWIGIGILLLMFLVITITSIALVSKQMTVTSGPSNMPWIISMAGATIPLLYIGMIVPMLPILFLITSWFVGINGVHSSRIFHYSLWSCLAFSIIFVVLGLIFTIIILANCWPFNDFIPEVPDKDDKTNILISLVYLWK